MKKHLPTDTERRRANFCQLVTALILVLIATSSHATTIIVTSTNGVGDVDSVVNGNCSIFEAHRAASRNEAFDACPAGQPSEVAVDDIVLPEETTFTLTLDASKLVFFDEVNLHGNGSILERDISSTEKFGLITVIEDTLTIENLTIRGGDKSGFGERNGGGGIFVTNGNLLVLRDSIVEGNKADLGGGIFAGSFADIQMENSIVRNNEAVDGDGGGVYLESRLSDLTAIDSVFEDNVASFNGGAISMPVAEILKPRASLFILRRVILRNNRASVGGGALYMSGFNSGSIIEDSSIYGNFAEVTGGAIYNTIVGAIIRLVRSAVHDNSSGSGGATGGISADGGARAFLEIIDSTISGNSGAQITAGRLGLFWVVHSTIMGRVQVAGTLENFEVASSYIQSCQFNIVTNVISTDNWFAEDSCDGTADGDPLLGPLQNNGGLSLSHLPLPESPLIGAADTPHLRSANTSSMYPRGRDQRRFFRPETGRDIGSLETQTPSSFYVVPLKNGKAVVFEL